MKFNSHVHCLTSHLSIEVRKFLLIYFLAYMRAKMNMRDCMFILSKTHDVNASSHNSATFRGSLTFCFNVKIVTDDV